MAIRTALTEDGASVTSVGLDVTVTRPFSMLAPYPCHIPMTSGSASFLALRYVYCIEWWLPKSQRQFAIEHGSTSQAASEQLLEQAHVSPHRLVASGKAVGSTSGAVLASDLP
jgi:hypothetical protein